MPRADITVHHRGGDQFTIDVRKHSLTVDHPLDAGGEDLGPTPTELLVGSLAACMAFYARRFMKRHGLSEDLSVTADWELGNRPTRVGRIDIWVDAPSVPPEM